MPSPDSEIVERLKQGDESAFELLVTRHHGSLVRVARTFVDDPAIAEEVVQDTWLGVLKGLPRFEGRSSLKTWIFSILANRARTRAVREKRTVPFSDIDDVGTEAEPAVDPNRFTADGRWSIPPQAWGADSPERQLLRGETMQTLQRALAMLPPRQRAVVTMRDVEGLNSSETCNILAISETNQRALLHRGRSRLRAALERHLGGTQPHDAT